MRVFKSSLIISALLCVLAGPVLGQEHFPWFTKDFPKEEFAERRARVMEAIGADAIAVLQGAPSPPGYIRFRQDNDFYYLSGVEVAHAYMLLDGSSKQTRLYLPHRNPRRESVEGVLLSPEISDQVIELTGVDAVFPTEDLLQHLGRMARASDQKTTVYLRYSPPENDAGPRDMVLRALSDIAADPFDGRPSRNHQFRNKLKAQFPEFQYANVSPIIDEMRLIKSPREIALLRKTTRLQGLALMEAMRSTQPGVVEHELDAVAKYIFFRNGAQGDGYYSLVAGGTNAWYPHYHWGTKTLRDGELLLMDYAPDVGYYTTDVTRMWPVNGKFNTWQRELYTFYMKCYRAILDNIRPHETGQQIKARAAAQMQSILAESRFSKPHHRKAAERFAENYGRASAYVRTSLGHWVGMSAHDVGAYGGAYKPGMVFTIEPALRVPEEQIYIRLEDMILITETGTEILSDFVPMDIDLIERLMREPGMLQRYPAEVVPTNGR